jgi:hypothetical protein
MRKRTLRDWILREDFKRPDLKKNLKTEAYEIVVGKIA